MGSAGFMVAPLAARSPALAIKMGIEDAANACLEEGCSVDTIEILLKELKAEASGNMAGSKDRQQQLVWSIEQLEALSGDSNMNEIEAIVAAASRNFNVVGGFEFKGPAIGYTGKVGTTTTAGKSLD